MSSLYFEERIEEQKEDPENQKISFVFPWVIEVPPPNEDNEEDEESQLICSKKIVTSYNFRSVYWLLRLKNDAFNISLSGFVVSNVICNISYTLFCDNDMRLALYSSPKISTKLQIFDSIEFKPPYEFFEEFYDTFQEGKVAKIVIHLEFVYPTKIFNRLCHLPAHFLTYKHCDEYPEDMENDFKFAFLKDGDYSIKCCDGSIPALRMVLNVSSKFMRKYFKESKDDEFVVHHSIDVVTPVIYYLHSRCFRMPNSFDLDFADRLLKAFDFFELEQKDDFKDPIELSLCQKFIEERFDFNGILRWVQISVQHRLRFLLNMVYTVIANKFYFEWEQTFPQNGRNAQNPFFYEIFGPDSLNFFDDNEGKNFTYQTFESIESAFFSSIFSNVILD